MAEPAEKEPVSTTPADLAAGVDAVLARTFAGLDLAEEARKLGIPEETLRGLRDRLVELGEVARRAAAG
jgi:DNA-binding IclR family transcriptional regulator